MRKRKKYGVAALAMSVSAFAALTMATAAMAGTPSGEYAVFSQCPVSNEELASCIYSKTESGEVSLGSQKVPITNPIILQGGNAENEETGALTFVGAANGETLSTPAQNVPGGLLSIVECKKIEWSWLREDCEYVFENPSILGVDAVTELAEPASDVVVDPSNLIAEEGTAVLLPVKVHLENTLLGSECYIGSSSSPIDLALTTGTTSPPAPGKKLKGTHGDLVFGEEGVLNGTGVSLVGDSFTVPVASGCGPYGLLDGIVDLKLGLPAAAGASSAILTGSLHQGSARQTRKHE
jgi:hypothetical protein